MALTTDKQKRKNAPMARGLLDYFPNALAGVAELSRAANEQHNPGEEMHWARDKSNDHADCIIRHQVDWDQMDDDGFPHAAKVAWRALAQFEEYLIARGATPGRGTRISEVVATDKDDWILWDVYENSPKPEGKVQIRTRDGSFSTAYAQAFHWDPLSGMEAYEIVAYRVVND